MISFRSPEWVRSMLAGLTDYSAIYSQSVVVILVYNLIVIIICDRHPSSEHLSARRKSIRACVCVFVCQSERT